MRYPGVSAVSITAMSADTLLESYVVPSAPAGPCGPVAPVSPVSLRPLRAHEVCRARPARGGHRQHGPVPGVRARDAVSIVLALGTGWPGISGVAPRQNDRAHGLALVGDHAGREKHAELPGRSVNLTHGHAPAHVLLPVQPEEVELVLGIGEVNRRAVAGIVKKMPRPCASCGFPNSDEQSHPSHESQVMG